jgi:4a-hydroxytetrahydrobiopterin dehydratase
MMERLDETQRAHALAELPGWQGLIARDAIAKTFLFAEWRNVYRRVEIELTTHDAGGLTQKDIALACAIERINRAYLQG